MRAASGPPFQAALRPGPYLLKGNANEFAAGLGIRVASVEDAAAAAALARTRGPRHAVVTLGARGAVAVADEGAWHAYCPPVQALQDVGSGDAFLAGMAVSLRQGQGFADALRLGVALGAANTLRLGAGFFNPSDLEALRPQVQVVALAS